MGAEDCLRKERINKWTKRKMKDIKVWKIRIFITQNNLDYSEL